MSITGSLVGYENNNEITKKSSTNRSLLNITTNSACSVSKPCPSLNSSISNSIITTASSNVSHHQQHSSKCQNSLNRKNRQKHLQQMQQQHNEQQSHLHLNSLWSIWYGVLVTLFQGYLAIHGAYRFLGCSLIQWKVEPVVELNVQIVLCGVAFILLPLFFASAVFKVGNLANDGIKLATMAHSRCSVSPHDGLEEEAKGGTLRALWTHGGPTAAFIHIVIAMCLLLPRLLLEARIIENGLLPRENIWRNELDFITTNRDRLVVLSFITSPYQNISANDTSNYYWDEDFNVTNFYNRKMEHEYKISYPRHPFYDNSDAIEKFRPDSELMESHENLELELAYSTTPIPISTSKTTKIVEIRFPTITPRSSKSIRIEGKRVNGRQSKKQLQKLHRNDEKKYKSAEVDRELEIKLEKPIDFSRSNEFEMSTVFESSATSKDRTTTARTMSTTSSEEQTTTRKQTYQTTKMSLRDSDIHIVKPEKLPEIIPATPISTNSKIIEIKTKKVKRMANNELSVEIEPEYLIGAISTTNISSPPSLVRLDGFSGMLQTFFGVEKELDVSSFSHPPSMEFLNLILALIVWSVRYPAVFWSATKPFATVFSVQMVANTIDIILSYTGMTTLYKLQVVGQILPIQSPTLLLNAVVTISLFILSTILVIASSLILYLYGHGRLAAKIRDRSMITVKNSETWIYFAHCASLCLVLALAVVKAPLMHDLCATYRGSLDSAVLFSALGSVIHLFLWIVIWLGLTAKRRWTFKLPPLQQFGISSAATQPLLISARGPGCNQESKGGVSTTSSTDGVEDTIYWPKLTPSSPKLKVTFNEVTSTSEDVLIIGEHDGKRNTARGTTLCITSIAGETDDGDYATLRSGPGGGGGGGGNNGGVGGNLLHLSEYDELPPPPMQLLPPNSGVGGDFGEDNTSEEGKLLAFVRDDSVTYASTRDLEPPHPPPPLHSNMQSPLTSQPSESLTGSPEHLVSPLAPVTVTVHTNEAHVSVNTFRFNNGFRPFIINFNMNVCDALSKKKKVHLVGQIGLNWVKKFSNFNHSCPFSISSSSTPRCLRRADSGVPNEALTPRSDTTSTTESTTSPPERAPSETSSGVHSGEEREEVVIRPRVVCKPTPKPPPPAIQEEPFGRSTNMKMSSFNNNDGKSSATLPLTRSLPEQRIDYSHCSTMPLPIGCHQNQYKPQVYTPTASKQQILHTTLPNGVRYSNPHFLRRIPHVTKAESPYGHLGLGAGHHTFSKLLQDPLHSLAATSIPEDRDSANYSMSSEQECVYANTQHIDKPFS